MKLRQYRGSEAGFTLIELLIVLVVIPLIIGGVAEALIVSFNNESANSNRLSDQVNAQLTQDYLVRDVQGAAYITTKDNSSGTSFLSISPEVCSPGSGSLLMAFFHPAQAGGKALDAAWWLTGTGNSAEVDRYSCTLSSTYTTTSLTKTAVATVPPGSTTGSVLEAITSTSVINPGQFSSAAALGWTPVAAFTTASSTNGSSPLSGGTLTVGYTAGFSVGTDSSGTLCALSSTLPLDSGCTTTPTPITVGTSEGPVQLTCTGFTSNTFTGCGPTPIGAIGDNSPVTQATVSGVDIAVTEPATGFRYNLLGAPRALSPQSATAAGGGPTLLTLGTEGLGSINGGGGVICPSPDTSIKANICVGAGGAVVDSGGTVTCTPSRSHQYIYFESEGQVDTVAPAGASSCPSVAIAQTTSVPDPLASKLPNNGCMPNSVVTALSSNPTSTYNPSNQAPGVWTTQLSGTLEPGLYVVEAGIGSITSASYNAADPYFNGDSSAGVLLFVPGPGPYNAAQGCYTYATAASFTGTITGLVPFDSTQSSTYFEGNQTLSGVWYWQDATNTNAVSSLSGYTIGGLMYSPAADYSLGGTPTTFATGSMIIAGTAGDGTHLHLCLSWPVGSNWNDC